ncbi:Protein FAM83G [Merluccius polli]|uniref:Protein FAM83G n=1 Tax=Merluccius polli TaxID=89951 RepID=A0AA47M2Q1_MERPO|nr:Protein FAM83G [Merluccius polli]
MALSQLQCLDDNNVNQRTHEAKPEFFYCENQRLALEVLLRDGRDAFRGFLEARQLRGFLSDSELEAITRAVEPYDPGSDVLHLRPAGDVKAGDDSAPLSLQYWPDLSDTSVPQLDLGWPDCASYRGVTRTTVHTQPPQDDQAHIKEIVRKTIAHAQKVIAVVMDLFTDVDIFRDLLEAGYKRKVSVYILLERSTLPQFLSMCDQAKMHLGHLKNLRVRCGGGGELIMRSCTRLRGSLGHRFMFVDGDKAVSGSYRYTWMSSRLDRHLVTVVTGQAVDAFDRLFRELYANSSIVDLQQVAMEPEPESLPQPVVVAPPSAAMARKLYNPKYALLAMSTNNTSPASNSGQNSPKDSQDKAGVVMKGKSQTAKKAAQVEPPPIHPGLVDLEKANLIPYLPTWPEPDPSSDVIGFINVRDGNRPTQVHMQRSERFETSQAIRFSSPFSMSKETLPEVAQPRQHVSNLPDVTVQKAYPTQKVTVDKAQPPTLATQQSGQDVHMVEKESVETHTLTSEPKIKAEKQPVNTESKPSTNTATQQITIHHIDAPTPFSSKAPIIKPGSAAPTRPIQNLTIKDPGRYPDTASKNNVGQSTPTIDTDKSLHSEHVSNSDHMQTSNPASSHYHASLNAIHQQNAALPVQTQTRIAQDCTISFNQDLSTKSQSPSTEDFTPSMPISTLNCISFSTVSPASPAFQRCTSPSITTSVSVTSSPSSTTTTVPVVPPSCHSLSSPLPPFSSIPTSSIPSSASNPFINSHSNTSPLPCSTQTTSPLTPPVPKPRTVHLLMDSWSKCNVLNQPLDNGVVSEPGKLSGSGPVLDYCKTVFKQQDNVIMTGTRTQVGPTTVCNSTKSAEWQDRSDMKTYSLNDVKDGLSKKFPDSKKATERRTQSILTGNTLQADDKQIKEMMPKESGNTNQAENMVRSHRVIEELSKPDKDREIVTKPHFKKATHVQTNEGLLQQQSQTHTATASEPPSSFHAPENITVIDIQNVPKQNTDDTPGSLSVDNISCAHTQGGQHGVTTHPSNDKAVNHVHNRLNSAEAKAKQDSHTTEQQTRPHTLELPAYVLCSPTPEKEQQLHEAPACTPTVSKISPCTPTAGFRTPDAHCCSSPDTRTPTPDMSDGYVSSRDDSALSTTSDEYCECNESPHPSPIFDQGISLADDRFITTPFTHREYTRATSANTNIMPSPTHMNAANAKIVFETSANSSISPSFVPQTRAQTKYKGETEEESGREEYIVCIREDRAAILAVDEQSRTGSEGLSQTAQKGRHQLPLKIKQYQESTVSLSPQRQSDPPETVDVDRYASAKKSANIQTPTLPILRRSSSSASSDNTVSPFITPVPSPAPTPTPKRATAQPKAPQPDTEVGRSAVVCSRRGHGEGNQVFRKDSRQDRKWEEDLHMDEQKDTELGTKVDLSTSSQKSSRELRSETSTLSVEQHSGLEMKSGPWVARETQGKKGLRSPQGRPQQQNHHSQVSLQSPAAKHARPTRPYSGNQPPRSYLPAMQVSSKVDHVSPQSLHNSAPRQSPFKRHSSMTTTGSLKGADQKSPSEDFLRRSFHYVQPLAGQDSGPFRKPQSSFLYTYTNAQSQLQPQTQPMASGNQVAQTQSKYRQDSAVGDLGPGDPGQDLSKTGFSFSIGKLYNLKGLKNKGSSSPSQCKRSPNPSAQVRKSTG